MNTIHESALAPFLTLLADDLARQSVTAIQKLPQMLASRMEILMEGRREVDLDAPIEADTSL